jgi:hypothetical protein
MPPKSRQPWPTQADDIIVAPHERQPATEVTTLRCRPEGDPLRDRVHIGTALDIKIRNIESRPEHTVIVLHRFSPDLKNFHFISRVPVDDAAATDVRMHLLAMFPEAAGAAVWFSDMTGKTVYGVCPGLQP